MSRLFPAVVVCASTAVFAGTAGAVTIATFADPSTGPTQPLFTFNSNGAGGGTLSGSWLGNNLLLQTPGSPSPDFPNAHMTMLPVTVTGSAGPVFTLGPGSISFTDNTNVVQLVISFTSATLVNSLNFGASDFMGQNVTFSGPVIAALLPQTVNNEDFAFSFANPVLLGPPALPGSYTVTSSFTSSANIVPAPGAAALLGIGALLAGRRRR